MPKNCIKCDKEFETPGIQCEECRDKLYKKKYSPDNINEFLDSPIKNEQFQILLKYFRQHKEENSGIMLVGEKDAESNITYHEEKL